MVSRANTTRQTSVDTLLRYGTEQGWWRSGRATRYFFERQLYRDIDLRGKRMLDIGCGKGLQTLWAKAKGARAVTAMDPAGEGSRSNRVLDNLGSSIAALDYEGVVISESTFQAFEANGEKFDVALLSASINHLNEAACINLQESESSQNEFRKIFSQLLNLLNPNAVVIITDVSNRNFFGDIGLKNPFSPTIEWHKHQPPSVWVELLQEVGFVNAEISWMSPSQYFQFGIILQNAFCNYFRSSIFRIVVRAPGESI